MVVMNYEKINSLPSIGLLSAVFGPIQRPSVVHLRNRPSRFMVLHDSTAEAERFCLVIETNRPD